MSRFLNQRPFLSGVVSQLPFVRDAIARRELVGPNDVEPAFGSPVENLSFPVFRADGSREWKEVETLQAQLAAYTRSLFSFPDVAQGMQLDFINQSYTITNIDGIPVPQGFDDVLTIGRQTPALRVGPNGAFERQDGGLPRIEFNPVSGVASGIRVSPARQNLFPDSNNFSVSRVDVNYIGLTGSQVSDPELEGLSDPADLGTAWEFVAQADPTDSQAYVEIQGLAQTTPFSWSIYYKPMNTGARYIGWQVGSGNGMQWDTLNLTANFTQGTGTRFLGIAPFIERAPGGYVRLGIRNIGQSAEYLSTPASFQRIRLVLAGGEPWFSEVMPGRVISYPKVGTERFRIAGLQREQASPVITSYMPSTPTVLGARDAEDLIAPAETVNRFFRGEQGAFLIESTMNRFLNAGALLAAFAATTENNQITLANGPTNNQLRAVIRAQGVATLDATVTPTSVQASGYTKDFISYGPNEIIIARNGMSVTLPPAALPPTGALSRLLLGAALPGWTAAEGALRRFVFWPRAQSAAFAESITAI